MKKVFHALVIITMILFTCDLTGQVVEDTVIVVEKTAKVRKGSIFAGRPGKSMLMSLVIPGAGQIYNKSYLRVPFVWGAVGGMGALMICNTKQYRCYRDAYIAKIDGIDFNPPNICNNDSNNNGTPDIKELDATRIRYRRDQANEARQWAIIGFTVVWLANGVDAFVDAHLKDFDIDEDLSIDIGPKMDDDPYVPMRMGVFVQF